MASSGRGRRKERLKDIVQDHAGNIIYTGDVYTIAGDGQGRRIRLSLILLALALVITASGCIDERSAMGSFYVILPYIGEVSALFGLIWSSSGILISKDVRAYNLERSKSSIPAASMILTAFAVIGCVFSIIYIVNNGMGASTVKTIAYPLLKAASAAAAAAYRRTFADTEWIITE